MTSPHIIHQELRLAVDEILTDFAGSDPVAAYFFKRSQHDQAIRQDLLPFFVYQAFSQQGPERITPLLAAWGLYLAGCHFLDDAQDNGALTQVNHAVVALGAAQIALSQLAVGEETLRDIMDALGRVTALAAKAQNREIGARRDWSRADYFQIIGGKSAAIIASGVWLGGRLAEVDDQTLQTLKAFGLALGMSMQLGDDCLDLAEDLANGIYTLPVIEGLSLTEHPDHGLLTQLLDRSPLSGEEVGQIIFLLESMGAIAACQRITRAYQAQAAAVFAALPALEPYFASYVTVSD
jgi:hypothetical protein